MFKTKLIDFIEELMVLFEDKIHNRIIYNRLIHYRHHIKNRIEEEDLYGLAIEFLSKNNAHEMITMHNPQFMKMNVDLNLLWESCTVKNKGIIWKWVDVIMETLEPYLV